MRVLLVGASGQLGGHLHGLLTAGGHAVAGTWSSVSVPGLVHLDLEDQDALTAAFRDVEPDLVLVTAGWTWVDGNEDDPSRSRRVNCGAPLHLARLAAERGALFVTYSTDYVFDGRAGPYAEDDVVGPLNVYGQAKLEAEQALRALGPEHLILRTTTVFGPELQGKNFVYQLVRRLRAGQPFQVPSDQVATPSYGPDVARATLELIEQDQRGTWHVAGPDVLDRAAFARLVCEEWGLDFDRVGVKTTAELAQKAERPLLGGLRTGKLQSAGITLRPVREALADMRAEIEAGRAAPVD
jgi:dTDP-4-dehydrorhamnose reductase